VPTVLTGPEAIGRRVGAKGGVGERKRERGGFAGMRRKEPLLRMAAKSPDMIAVPGHANTVTLCLSANGPPGQNGRCPLRHRGGHGPAGPSRSNRDHISGGVRGIWVEVKYTADTHGDVGGRNVLEWCCSRGLHRIEGGARGGVLATTGNDASGQRTNRTQTGVVRAATAYGFLTSFSSWVNVRVANVAANNSASEHVEFSRAQERIQKRTSRGRKRGPGR
jgi:hypothetical protein